MAVKKTKEEAPVIPPELLKEAFKERDEFIDSIFNYKLNEELDEYSEPLTFKEKKELSKYDLQNVDNEANFDDLILKLAELRGVPNELLDEQPYSELAIWVRKVCYGTFDLKRAAKK